MEVATRVLCRSIDSSQRLYLMSHDFIWLSPLANLAFCMAIGVVLAVAVKLAPRAAGWFGPRSLCACLILPVLIAAGPRIYTSAWLLVSLGVAVCLVPIFGRHQSALLRWLPRSFPMMMSLVLVLAGFVFGDSGLKRARESSRPLLRPTSFYLTMARAFIARRSGYRYSLCRHQVRISWRSLTRRSASGPPRHNR
jgi:hypothetical protein